VFYVFFLVCILELGEKKSEFVGRGWGESDLGVGCRENSIEKRHRCFLMGELAKVGTGIHVLGFWDRFGD
jgi:hypothetical protein